ncbi:hypothetical protein [Streptomyces sp. NPDC057580]|uniref:hypothetical protein n=1 Tax=Streptomyces sp. NPDC057580 TaxID=3346173 RepID=UPI003684A83A
MAPTRGRRALEGMSRCAHSHDGAEKLITAARPSAAVPEDDVTALERQLSDLRFD